MYQGLTETPEGSIAIGIESKSVEETVIFRIPEDAPALRFLGFSATPARGIATRTTWSTPSGEVKGSRISALFEVDEPESRSLHFSDNSKGSAPYGELPYDLQRMVSMALAGEETSGAVPARKGHGDALIPRLLIDEHPVPRLYEAVSIRPGESEGHRNRLCLYDGSGEFIAAPLYRVEGMGDEYLAVSGHHDEVYDALTELGLAVDAGYRWQSKRVIEARGELLKITGSGYNLRSFGDSLEESYDEDSWWESSHSSF